MDLVERVPGGATFATRALVNVSDGGATNNAQSVHLTNSTVFQNLVGADGNSTTGVVFGNGTLRRCGFVLKLNLLQGWINGVAVGVPDTTVAALAAMNRVAIGCTYGGLSQPSSPTLIRRVMVYNRYLTDMAKKTKL
jgi:hypothetical protein